MIPVEIPAYSAQKAKVVKFDVCPAEKVPLGAIELGSDSALNFGCKTVISGRKDRTN